MTWAPTETQKTIYQTLTGDAALMALITGVFDSVPDNQTFPYVTMRIKPWENRANHDYDGLRARFQIDVWYQLAGRGDLKVQQIQKRIDELLNNKDICIDGWQIVGLRRQTVDIITEPDNITLHGVQIFNLLLGEV